MHLRVNKLKDPSNDRDKIKLMITTTTNNCINVDFDEDYDGQ